MLYLLSFQRRDANNKGLCPGEEVREIPLPRRVKELPEPKVEVLGRLVDKQTS